MDTVDNGGRSQAILIVTAIFLGISLVAVCLRCFVRTRLVRAFGWDDIVMVVAMVLNLAFAICGIIGAKNGMGRKLAHFVTSPPTIGAENFRRALLCWWLGQVFYVTTCVVAKISIIITLLRITVDRVHAWILYAALYLATAVGLLFFFFTIFQCHPVNLFWNRLSERGTCVDTQILIDIAYVYSVGTAVTDLTIALLPIALIWNLRMKRRTKAAVAGILGIGCLASAAVIVRIPFVKHYQDKEFLYNTYQISIWSNVEAGLGITAGSLTTLRPLGRFFKGGSSGSHSHSQNRTSYPLSSSMERGGYRANSKRGDQERGHKIWAGSEVDDYHGVTTTIMSSHRPNPSSSEEDLNPKDDRWRMRD
ncbi:hypothetical protein N7468_006098 [Penicillium chermesinum]|uniref:Rhodopsin domain-containing protein n=1 Tax=Penicillium chermesinum TaxID=63820 RepID=A0A9W9P2U7_9EURO|nr:uncharacterized protein N7468_006098 [Penicillium chermesinum]KAJ5233142.1 hypothetical protein N7468_006098 [Penicillium chermesinum]